MNVKLPKESEDIIRRRVESGDYSSAEAFLIEAIRHQAEFDEDVDALLADHPTLREEIEESDARGIEVPADEVFARLRDRQRRFEKEAGR